MLPTIQPLTFTNIWLCDDDADDHYVFTEALTQVLPQASLSIFPDGSEVLAEFTKRKPDILFMDINMPVVNGLEALRKIREIPALKELPVVIYSVSEQRSDISACHHLGATLYLVKPQLYQDLVTQLKAIFNFNWTDKNQLSLLQSDGKEFTSIPATE